MRPARPLDVVILVRRPLPGQFSLEKVFADLVGQLGAGVDVRIVRAPFESRGVVPRLRNVWFTSRLRADVVHIGGDIHYCALGVPRRRCVLTVADLATVRRLTGIRRTLFWWVWFRFPCWWAARLTAISPSTADELVAALPGVSRKTTVIPCSVAAQTEPPEVAPLARPARVLQVGTAPNKNLDRVVAALADLPVELRVVGRLDDEQRRLLAASGLDHSDASDLSDDELRREYLAADVLTFVSTAEGFGLPIVEAQSLGLPVVTSAVQPMSWVAGDAAVLVEPTDTAAIRAAVGRLLDDAELRRALRARGRANAQRFAPAVIADLYAALYRDVVAAR